MKCQMAEIFLRAVVSLNLKSAAVLKSCKPRVNQRHQSHQLLRRNKPIERIVSLSRRLLSNWRQRKRDAINLISIEILKEKRVCEKRAVEHFLLSAPCTLCSQSILSIIERKIIISTPMKHAAAMPMKEYA